LITQINQFQYYVHDGGVDDHDYDHVHNNCGRDRGDDDDLLHCYDGDGCDQLHDYDDDGHVQHHDYGVHHNILVLHDLSIHKLLFLQNCKKNFLKSYMFLAVCLHNNLQHSWKKKNLKVL